MNKKAIIGIIVVIVLVIIGYSIWGGNGSTTSTNTDTNTAIDTTDIPAGVSKDDYVPVTSATSDSSLVTRLKASSVAASETGSRVALVNGKAQFSGEGIKGTITMGDVAVAKTVASGSKYAITTLGVNSGASTYQYVVLFEDASGNLTDKSYAVVGQDVKITGLRADEISGQGLVVTVTYTAPGSSATRTKILVVENGSFNAAKEINL